MANIAAINSTDLKSWKP